MKCPWSCPNEVRLILGVLVLVLAYTGCSSNQRLTINGSVSYKGQPVKTGIVKFHGPGDHLEMAYIRNGAFTITDVIPGEVQVTVEEESPNRKADGIPGKYADPKTAGLTFTIKSSIRELPIALE